MIVLIPRKTDCRHRVECECIWNLGMRFLISATCAIITDAAMLFAFWAIRKAALADASSDLTTIFQASRDHGLRAESISATARNWAGKVGLSESEVRSYLTENIHYHLDQGCLEGLELFYRYAAECGALPQAPALQFVEVAKFATT